MIIDMSKSLVNVSDYFSQHSFFFVLFGICIIDFEDGFHHLVHPETWPWHFVLLWKNLYNLSAVYFIGIGCHHLIKSNDLLHIFILELLVKFHDYMLKGGNKVWILKHCFQVGCIHGLITAILDKPIIFFCLVYGLVVLLGPSDNDLDHFLLRFLETFYFQV